MNLTILQLTYLLQERANISNKERKELLTKILKTLKNKDYKHTKKNSIICTYKIKDNGHLEFNYLECELNQFKRKDDFYNTIERIIKEKYRGQDVIISDGDWIYFYGDEPDKKYYHWKQNTLISEIKRWWLRKIIITEKINKKFDRLEKYINEILQGNKTQEEWMQDKTLEKCLSIMKQFNCELCFKFWRYDDQDIKRHAVFYKVCGGYQNVKEYIKEKRCNALMNI